MTRGSSSIEEGVSVVSSPKRDWEMVSLSAGPASVVVDGMVAWIVCVAREGDEVGSLVQGRGDDGLGGASCDDDGEGDGNEGELGIDCARIELRLFFLGNLDFVRLLLFGVRRRDLSAFVFSSRTDSDDGDWTTISGRLEAGSTSSVSDAAAEGSGGDWKTSKAFLDCPAPSWNTPSSQRIPSTSARRT